MEPNQNPTNDKSNEPDESNAPVQSFDQPTVDAANLIEPSTPESTNDFVPTPSEPTAEAVDDSLGVQPAYPVEGSQVSDASTTETPADATTTEPPAPTEPATPVVGAAPVVSDTPSDQTPVAVSSSPETTPNNPKKRTFLKTLIIAVVALAVIGGGSAAAYYGVVLPNKPENVLLASVANGLQQTEGSFSGTINADPLESSGTGVKMSFDGAGNMTKKVAKVNTKVVVSGIDVSAELRYVDKNLYVKMGDLTTATSLLNSYSPLYGGMLQSVVGQIANKWIVIDSTLINKASNSCALDADIKLTDQDMDLLLKQYKAHPFTTISSVSDDTVDGKKVQKYVLSLDDDKMAVFAASIKDISPIKNLLKCDKNNTWDPKTIADHDKTPMTLWIDKSNKQILQLSSHSTPQDEKDMTYHMTATIKFAPKSVDVTAPASSTPIMQLLGNLGGSLNDQTMTTDFSSI